MRQRTVSWEIASAWAIIRFEHDFYDYEDKYLVDGARMARVDFLYENSTSRLFVNEINTIPGFTSISMYAKMWEATGVPYAELIDRLIALALDRHAEKRATRYSR